MDRKLGRKNDELRPVEMIVDYITNPDGAVLISFGDTKVLCTAMIEDKVPQFLKGSGKGWITAEYSLLPGSTLGRTSREASKGKVTGRTSEIQRLIGRSLRAVTDLDALGERTIWLDCDVIQADGGTRTAAITGSYVALCRAFEKMLANKQIKQSPLFDAVAAVSVGFVSGIAMLDLDYQEDSQAEVDMNIVMTGKGNFVEIQGTAEGRTFNDDELSELIKLAKSGINRLMELQKSALTRG